MTRRLSHAPLREQSGQDLLAGERHSGVRVNTDSICGRLAHGAELSAGRRTE